MLEQITIYHTNDLHSHFQYWPHIDKLMKEGKAAENGQVFLFDIGDHMDRFHPFSDGTFGKGNVQLLNETGYDAVTIGNNEGITLAHEDLDSLYDDAEFECVVANLYYTDGTRPAWVKPYTIFETEQKTKIGVLGVTVNFSNFYGPLNWKITDPFEELSVWLPKLKEEANIVIILSHLGETEDERMAEVFPEIDLILGGHTHHILPEGKQVHSSLLCCTGKYGQYVGKVRLEYDHTTKEIIERQAELIPTESVNVEHNENLERELFKKGKKLLAEPIAHLPYDLKAEWYQDSEINSLICSGLTEWCEADCSFINAGILLDGLGKGVVTAFDIQQICPHPINPCTIKLSGSELKEVLLQTLDDQYTKLEVKGFGFRGKIFGKIIYDRVQFVKEGSLMKIFIGTEEIDPERIYTLATLDMFAFARFYPILTRKEKIFFLPEFIRDILSWKLSQHFPLAKI